MLLVPSPMLTDFFWSCCIVEVFNIQLENIIRLYPFMIMSQALNYNPFRRAKTLLYNIESYGGKSYY